MPIELVIASIGILFLAVLGLYAASHRTEDERKDDESPRH